MSTNGWRAAYAFLGLLVIVIAAPTVGLLLRETPASMGLQPDGGSAPAASVAKTRSQPAGLDGRDARRTTGFWRLAVAFFLVSVVTSGCVVHLVPLLTDRGVSTQSAAFVASVAGGAVLVGRVWTGYLLDRFFAPTVTMGFFLALALGVFLLWTGATETSARFAAMLVGLGLGAEVDIIPYLVGRSFGLRAFGEIYGYLLAGFVLGAGVGPLLMGCSVRGLGEIMTFAGEIDYCAACRPGALWNPASSWAVLRLRLESHLSLVVTMRNIEAVQMLLHFGQSRSEERDSAPQIGSLSMRKVIGPQRQGQIRHRQNHYLIAVTIQCRGRASEFGRDSAKRGHYPRNDDSGHDQTKNR